MAGGHDLSQPHTAEVRATIAPPSPFGKAQTCKNLGPRRPAAGCGGVAENHHSSWKPPPHRH